MITISLIITSLIVGALVACSYCFDDNDPDIDWYDNYAVIQCPHLETTNVTVESTPKADTVHIICDACCEVMGTYQVQHPKVDIELKNTLAINGTKQTSI